MSTQEEEKQLLTDEILNLKFAKEKINKDLKDAEDVLADNKKQNEELVAQNKAYEEENKKKQKDLEEINDQLTEKRKQFEEADTLYKEEIDRRMNNAETAEKEANEKLAGVIDREITVAKREENASVKEAENLAVCDQLETKEKEINAKEVMLNERSNNLSNIEELLNHKKLQLDAKEASQVEYEASLRARETEIVSKFNAISKSQIALNQQATAIENERVNLENNKHKFGYVMRALEDVQTWCITNIGKELTMDIVEDIKSKILDIAQPNDVSFDVITPENEEITPENEVEPSTDSVVDLPETQENVGVVDTPIEEEKSSNPNEEKVDDVEKTPATMTREDLIAEIQKLHPEYIPSEKIGIPGLTKKWNQLLEEKALAEENKDQE